MRYDFTSMIDRAGKDAIAVDAIGQPGPFAFPAPREGFDVIPMWIADMNFATVPTIPEAIMARAQHALYGYFSPRKEYFDAIIDWQRRRNGVSWLSWYRTHGGLCIPETCRRSSSGRGGSNR